MARKAKIYSVDFTALERKAGNYKSMNMFERGIIDRILILNNSDTTNLSQLQHDTLDSVYSVMSELTPLQQQVLQLSFGLGDVEQLTEEQIGQRLGIAHQTVSRIKLRAIKSIRRILSTKK